MGNEQRRAERVPVELMVMVEGVDDVMVRRRGNISATGLMFEAEHELAEIGGLEFLHLSSLDRSVAVAVMAQLVRTIPRQRDGVDSIAHAFELLPQSDDVQQSLDQLLEAVGAESVQALVDETDSLPAATVFRLRIDDLSLRSSWPIAAGSKVQLAITSSDGQTRIPFEGHVLGTEPENNGHRTHVQLAEAGVRSAPLSTAATQADSITGSIDLLFTEWMNSQDADAPEKSKRHLVGRLDRVPLSGLLMLFDMERISGELHIEIDDENFILFLREGTLIDAEPATDEELRTALQTIAGTARGRFEFRACDVDREDRVKSNTTMLLLDLARERDEAARDEPSSE